RPRRDPGPPDSPRVAAKSAGPRLVALQLAAAEPGRMWPGPVRAARYEQARPTQQGAPAPRPPAAPGSLRPGNGAPRAGAPHRPDGAANPAPSRAPRALPRLAFRWLLPTGPDSAPSAPARLAAARRRPRRCAPVSQAPRKPGPPGPGPADRPAGRDR